MEVLTDEKANIMAMKFEAREQSKTLVISVHKLVKEDIPR